MLRTADRQLQTLWREIFNALPVDSRMALKKALLALRIEALARADVQWKRHKAPMAAYWKTCGVYAGHLARSIDVPKSPRKTPGAASAVPGTNVPDPSPSPPDAVRQ